jgi:uncharacterized protein
LKPTEHRFTATTSAGPVSALLLLPPTARCLLVFGHGAGAGMRHAFMESISARLAERGAATFRYQFPYTEAKKGRPDPQPVLLATVRSAVAEAASLASGVPLFAGGKSMGGRMTSLAAASAPGLPAASAPGLAAVRGIVFFGFPLHAAGRPSAERGAHLADTGVPLLFLQGTRDSLAGLELLTPVVEALGERATLHVIDGADHGFHVLKRSGRTDDDVLDELAGTAADWMMARA